jgi:hypothetical protein
MPQDNPMEYFNNPQQLQQMIQSPEGQQHLAQAFSQAGLQPPSPQQMFDVIGQQRQQGMPQQQPAAQQPPQLPPQAAMQAQQAMGQRPQAPIPNMQQGPNIPAPRMPQAPMQPDYSAVQADVPPALRYAMAMQASAGNQQQLGDFIDPGAPSGFTDKTALGKLMLRLEADKAAQTSMM